MSIVRTLGREIRSRVLPQDQPHDPRMRQELAPVTAPSSRTVPPYWTL
jgi:hypothetical protein